MRVKSIRCLLLVIAVFAVVTLAWLMLSTKPRAQPAMAPLPESLLFSTRRDAREKLITNGYDLLQDVRKRYAGNLLVEVNCEVARERLVREYEMAECNPLMLAASILPLHDDGDAFMFCAINPRRETDRLILEGTSDSGRRVRVVYHFAKVYKEPELVIISVHRMFHVDPQEIATMGERAEKALGVEVHFPDVRPGFGPWPVPSSTSLVAAIGDRNGHLSNFVEVLRPNRHGLVEEWEVEKGLRSGGEENAPTQHAKPQVDSRDALQ